MPQLVPALRVGRSRCLRSRSLRGRCLRMGRRCLVHRGLLLDVWWRLLLEPRRWLLLLESRL